MPATDGRVQRGERNRAAIVEALLTLLEEGDARPSARAVAARAGVSLRSVFQHFEDMESLHAACARRQHERIAPLLADIDPSAPLTARVDAIAAQRAKLYERIAPVRRATVRAAASSPVLRNELARMHADACAQLARAFGRELSGPGGRVKAAALAAATSFENWDHLRSVQGLPVTTARQAVALLARGVLQ